MAAQNPSFPRTPFLSGRRPMLLALLFGAIAAGLIVAYLASRDGSGNPSAAGAGARQVVVAKQDIPAGAKIERSMLEVRELPANALVSGSTNDIAAVVGEVARYPLAAGEQVTTTRLVDAPKQEALSFQIPKGLRGFTVAVSITNTPAALMVPGDFVDVIVSAELVRLLPTSAQTTTQQQTGLPNIPGLTDQDKPKAAVTLVQNVQVLSVQRKVADDGVVYDDTTRGKAPDEDKDVTFVTLGVTPEQAQLLWLASQEGKITLTLRAFGDNEVTKLQPVAEPVRLP